MAVALVIFQKVDETVKWMKVNNKRVYIHHKTVGSVRMTRFADLVWD